MLVRPLSTADLPGLRDLATLADAEAFRFVARFVADLADGKVQLDGPCEFFLTAVIEDRLVALGGVTPDPYLGDPTIGRLRHLYVHPESRRAGIGRVLVDRLEERATRCYAGLRLRTDTAGAAQFYEALGYQRAPGPSATHVRVLSRGLARAQRDER